MMGMSKWRKEYKQSLLDNSLKLDWISLITVSIILSEGRFVVLDDCEVGGEVSDEDEDEDEDKRISNNEEGWSMSWTVIIPSAQLSAGRE